MKANYEIGGGTQNIVNRIDTISNRARLFVSGTKGVDILVDNYVADKYCLKYTLLEMVSH